MGAFAFGIFKHKGQVVADFLYELYVINQPFRFAYRYAGRITLHLK
jgi:hypothetical protein